MVSESYKIRTDLITTDSFKMTKVKDMVDLFILMAIILRAIGKMENVLEKAPSNTLMVQSMLESGLMINNMAKGKKYGLMVKLIKESINLE